MANIFTNKKVNDEVIQMSNGLTSVFIETFCLGGADLATENFQRDLMIWFGQRDWAIMGMGVEGFDISEIIWNNEEFDNQKKFILDVIDSVSKKKNWEKLSYNPNEDFLFGRLDVFRRMIHSFKIEMIEQDDWEYGIFDFDGEIDKYDKCEKHNIYKHWNGCVICNNEPKETTANKK